MIEKPPTTINDFPKHYGIFPYVIVHLMPTVYKPIPIKFNLNGEAPHHSEQLFNININNCPSQEIFDQHLASGELLDTMKRATASLSQHFKKPCCLVLNENECFYYDDGVFRRSNNIPYGGALIINETPYNLTGKAQYR